jgi:hypothetical protein
VSERLTRFAAERPRAFVVTAPGGTAARLAVEAALRRRGRLHSSGPAAADLLVVCGDPGEALAEAIDVVWADLPSPRARTAIRGAPPAEEDVSAALDEAAERLSAAVTQRAEARHRIAAGPWDPAATGGGDHGDDHDDHGGAQGNHAHGHHMGAPAGLAMAERAADRDGLKLDVLHVPIGPVLKDWPAGLRIATVLQGDVIQSAEASVLRGTSVRPFWDAPCLAATGGKPVTQGTAERRRAAAHLDSLARLLSVAGWPDASGRAAWLRDEALAGRPVAALLPAFSAFARRVGRSRPLRWMTRGLGVIDEDAVRRHGLTGPAARHVGDVAARLSGWLGEAGEAIARADDGAPQSGGAEGPRGPVDQAPSAALLAVLPALLTGAEWAAARLIVASLDPDIDQLTDDAAAVAGTGADG